VYGVETKHEEEMARSFGNEEVDSSILSSSTITIDY
jgi:hypothetical protein